MRKKKKKKKKDEKSWWIWDDASSVNCDWLMTEFLIAWWWLSGLMVPVIEVMLSIKLDALMWLILWFWVEMWDDWSFWNNLSVVDARDGVMMKLLLCWMFNFDDVRVYNLLGLTDDEFCVWFCFDDVEFPDGVICMLLFCVPWLSWGDDDGLNCSELMIRWLFCVFCAEMTVYFFRCFFADVDVVVILFCGVFFWVFDVIVVIVLSFVLCLCGWCWVQFFDDDGICVLMSYCDLIFEFEWWWCEWSFVMGEGQSDCEFCMIEMNWWLSVLCCDDEWLCVSWGFDGYYFVIVMRVIVLFEWSEWVLTATVIVWFCFLDLRLLTVCVDFF